MRDKKITLTRIRKFYYVCLSKAVALLVNNRGSKLILFGARDGEYFMDNSRALYEYFERNHAQENYYWLTTSPQLEAQMKAQGLRVARIDSLKGVYLLNRAKYAFFTNRLRDVSIDYRAVPSGLKVIFLSHGQSIKNTRLAVNAGVDAGYRKDTEIASRQMKFAVSTSPFMAEVQAASNGLKPEMYQITGFPRNDWMINPPQEAHEEWNRFTGGKKYAKVILYAPTWRRNEPKTMMFPFEDYNPEELADFVNRNNILLLLRLHVQELSDNPGCIELLKKLSTLTPNIRLATIKEFVEANYLLPFVDALISDYSSIYHDYLLLNRPIYFIPYDLEHFERENGFKYPYLEMLPGPVIGTQENLLMHFSRLMADDDQYTGHRAKLSKMIYSFLDGDACKRVANLILKS